MLGIVGQTKGAAVTGLDGTWVTVLLLSAESVCERVARKIEPKTSLCKSGTKKMHIEWLHERQARICKTVAVTFLIWPAFNDFFRFIWSGNQGGQHKCPSYSNADRMAGTVTVYRLPIRLPAKSALTWPVV